MCVTLKNANKQHSSRKEIRDRSAIRLNRKLHIFDKTETKLRVPIGYLSAY